MCSGRAYLTMVIVLRVAAWVARSPDPAGNLFDLRMNAARSVGLGAIEAARRTGRHRGRDLLDEVGDQRPVPGVEHKPYYWIEEGQNE